MRETSHLLPRLAMVAVVLVGGACYLALTRWEALAIDLSALSGLGICL
jgi:hypothetical protein